MDAYSYNHINDVIQDLYEQGKLGEEEFDLLCECTDKADRYDRYKWHDLRNNPNDLPKPNVRILYVFKLGNSKNLYNTGIYDEGYFKYVPYSYIAWREIEPFEEEG